MTQIVFNEPYRCKTNISLSKFSGDGPYTQKCTQWFEEQLGVKCLLTTSCTHALEMMALLIDIKLGDEIIMPSYTFVSTANAFALRGAKIVFVDIRPDTMNIDENLIEQAITPKTKAIMVVHYAGVACEMDSIKAIADKHELYLLEDAAQGMMSTYKRKPLGTIGHMGTYSFHETKNFHCGEGGLLIINDERFIKKAEMIREKGTDRSSFLRGEVDKYTWRTVGSSYLPSELNAAYLWQQLEIADEINNKRLSIWNKYFELLSPLAKKYGFELPVIPEKCQHNAHMFYIKLRNLTERTKFIEEMKKNEVMCIFHYVPLHSSPMGRQVSRFNGEDIFTTKESERLVRLPMHCYLEEKKIILIVEKISSYFGSCHNV